MLKVYIASPYTKGDVAVNVKRQIDVAAELIKIGMAPYVPVLSHFIHMAHPQPYQTWTELDNEWVEASDWVLRLPGESAGADAEVRLAEHLGIPVAHDIRELPGYRKV